MPESIPASTGPQRWTTRRWGYSPRKLGAHLPEGQREGTLVRETWDVSQDRQRPMLRMGSMPKQAEDGMRATLERIAALVEP